MKLIVGINKIEVDESDSFNQGEYNVHKVEYELDEVYNDLVKMATFSDDNGDYAIQLLGNECTIPYEILKTDGVKEFGLFGYELENEELKLRYSPTPVKKYVDVGSYKEEFDNYEVPTPTDLEEIKSDINRLNNDIIEIGEDVVNIEGDINDIGDDIDSLKDRVTNLEEDMGDVSTALDSINGEVI